MTKKEYYVVATDKMLSGWGMASKGRSAIVVVCHDSTQANYCEKALQNAPEMKNVKVFPYKPNVMGAHVQYYDFLDCPAWNKDYMFSYGDEVKDEQNQSTTLTESQLRIVIKDSIDKVLKESIQDDIDEEVYESLMQWVAKTLSQYKNRYKKTDIKDTIIFNLRAAEEEVGRITF